MNILRWFQSLGAEYRYGLFLLAVLAGLLTHFDMYELTPLGGDWVYPANAEQARRLLELSTTSWLNSFVIFLGSYQINLFPSAFFSWIITQVDFPHLLLLLTAIVYFSLLSLMKELGASPIAAVASFFLFVFSAVFFNYLIMGWLYVLVAISMLPLATLAYIKALRGSYPYLIVAGVLFALSPIQSQATVWFFIVFFALSAVSLINGVGLKRNVRVLGGVLLIFFFCNAYWLPGLFIFPPFYVANSDLVESTVSVGTFSNFSLVNAIRAWGSLFNFQFETVHIREGAGFFSFLLPLLAIVGIGWHKSKYKWAFALLMLFPMIILFLGMNRDLLAVIPFGNVFRDLSRFIVLNLFGSSILAGMGVNVILEGARQYWSTLGLRISSVVLFSGLVIAAHPWWSGALFDWEASRGRDIRLRFKEYPTSWFRLNERLGKERLEAKALFYPLGGTVSYLDDRRFRGAFQEASDNFANLAPVPGIVTINDRKFGVVNGLMTNLATEYPSQQQLESLAELGVRLFIFRHNIESPYPMPSEKLIMKMMASDRWDVWFEDDAVTVFAAREFKPNLYAVYDSSSCTGEEAIVEYRRINPALFRLRVHNARCPFILILNETFSAYWRLASAPEISSAEIKSVAQQSWFGIDLAASEDEIKEYISAGYLTIPLERKEIADKIDYISRRNNGAIQNDNLPSPTLRELLCAHTVSSTKHSVVNRYVNAWYVQPESICPGHTNCGQNAGSTGTLDLIIEFIPQRVFLIGRWITLLSYAALGVLFIYLVMKVKKEDKKDTLPAKQI